MLSPRGNRSKGFVPIGFVPIGFFCITIKTYVVCKAEGSGGRLWYHRDGRCPLCTGSAATVGDLSGLAAPSLLSVHLRQYQAS